MQVIVRSPVERSDTRRTDPRAEIRSQDLRDQRTRWPANISQDFTPISLTGKSSRDDGEYLAAACLSLRKSITGSSVALRVSNVRREST
ncbi:hypothetical protein PV326_009972 [Microctonus aethiopoides]|nr:hypothetical protein PV326_009972 [Microctonus aethiopoides]